VDKHSAEFKRVADKFVIPYFGPLVLQAERVCNSDLMKKYEEEREYLAKGGMKMFVGEVFHGTSRSCADSIARNGFDCKKA